MKTQVKEYREKDGRKGTALDITLNVWDEGGKVVTAIEYHEPPLVNRKTDEDIKKQYQRINQGREVLKMFKGTFADPLVDLADKDAQLRAQQLAANYNFSKNPKILDYQFQEKAVRMAVESLMAKAPMPGDRPSTEVSVRIERPRLKREPQAKFDEGVALLNQTLFDEAIATWQAIDADDPAIHYDLGVAYLGQAAKQTATNPVTAYENAKKAGVFFAKAARKHEDASVLNATRQLIRNIESYYGGVPTTESVASKDRAVVPDSASPAPLSPVGEKYALLIGVGKFLDERIPRLSAPRQDVELLSAALTAVGFKVENITTILDEGATLRKLRNALPGIGAKVSANSLVVIAVSTHGTDPSQEPLGKEGYIICHDSNPDDLYGTAYPMIDFREHAERLIPCQAKVIFQDTCHSAAGSTQFSGPQMKFTVWPAYMAVFAAADTSQPSIETRDGNGLFTLCVANFLASAKGSVALPVLRDHVISEVPSMARGLGAAQNPQVFFGPGADSITIK